MISEREDSQSKLVNTENFVIWGLSAVGIHLLQNFPGH